MSDNDKQILHPSRCKQLRRIGELGIDIFIFSGYPYLEESYRFAELVFPLLGKSKVGLHAQLQAHGEIMANRELPSSARREAA